MVHPFLLTMRAGRGGMSRGGWFSFYYPTFACGTNVMNSIRTYHYVTINALPSYSFTPPSYKQLSPSVNHAATGVNGTCQRLRVDLLAAQQTQ